MYGVSTFGKRKVVRRSPASPAFAYCLGLSIGKRTHFAGIPAGANPRSRAVKLAVIGRCTILSMTFWLHSTLGRVVMSITLVSVSSQSYTELETASQLLLRKLDKEIM